MNDNLPMDVLVTLPLYNDGVAAGRDIGLRLALDTVTAERIRLDMLPDSPRLAYADGRLAMVAYAIADLFKAGPTP